MKDEGQDLIPAELRRKTVERLAKGMADGSITIDREFVESRSDEGRDEIARILGKIGQDLNTWLSNLEKGIPQEAEEVRLFNNYMTLEAFGVMRDTYSPTKVEHDIEKLNARMDSTNRLLLDISKALKNMQDDVDFMRGVFDKFAEG